MGKVCTFLGHRDSPLSIRPQLRETLAELILQHDADLFYVGRQGAFDALVYSVLKELAILYPHIRFAVVLERLPTDPNAFTYYDAADTLYPEGIEAAPPRFAISWRNRWMVTQADYVVCYVDHSWGGAARFVRMAQSKKKIIRNLALPD